MGKIYVGQDKLVLYILTGTDLSDATSVQLGGTDPSGNALSPMWTTIIENSAEADYHSNR